MSDVEFLAFLREHPELWETVLNALQNHQTAESPASEQLEHQKGSAYV